MFDIIIPVVGAVISGIIGYFFNHFLTVKKVRRIQDNLNKENNLLNKLVEYKMTDVSLLENKLKLISTLEDNGVDIIIYGWSQSDDYIKDKIKNSHKIKILYTAGDIFFSLNMESFKKALDNGAEMKVILATKNSMYVKETMEMEKEKHSNNDINRNITKAVGELEHWIKECPKGKIIIKHFNTQFRANIMIIDDTAYYTPLLPPRHSRHSLTFRLKKGRVLKDCSDHFDRLFELLPDS
ncbi:MAG: hypothetical protein LBC71_01245 [Oscillospiraceae bacterium]|jgi:hypothetical protein|nr:hypothetical protein [Oscillospiraceae bacterium]